MESVMVNVPNVVGNPNNPCVTIYPYHFLSSHIISHDPYLPSSFPTTPFISVIVSSSFHMIFFISIFFSHDSHLLFTCYFSSLSSSFLTMSSSLHFSHDVVMTSLVYHLYIYGQIFACNSNLVLL